jgi:hypothetical protein
MPKTLQTPRRRCDRCGGSVGLPHDSDAECRTALSTELDALLNRAHEISTSMWKLAKIERRAVPPSGAIRERKRREES